MNMSQGDTEQVSDGERNSFPATLHRMVTKFSNTSPKLGGWSSCGKMFSFDPYTDEEAMKDAIAPFFSHANFASMRRQLSAYNFMRGPTGHWFHKLFHRKSTDEDLAIIQQARRRRSQVITKEHVHKVKSLKENKLKTVITRKQNSAPMPRNLPYGVGPLANVDVNLNRGRKPNEHPHFASKRQHLPYLGHGSTLGSFDTDSDSLASCEEPSELLASACPLTTVVDGASAAAVVKRNVLRTYFCKTCVFMEGKICCNKCPAQHHENCKTSRCVRRTQHPDLMQILA